MVFAVVIKTETYFVDTQNKLNRDKIDLHKLIAENRRMKKLIGEKKRNDLIKIVQQMAHNHLRKKYSVLLSFVFI